MSLVYMPTYELVSSGLKAAKAGGHVYSQAVHIVVVGPDPIGSASENPTAHRPQRMCSGGKGKA